MNALDRHDIFFAAAQFPGQMIGAVPAAPHVTRILLREHRVLDLFHVKPVYYETREGHWRPLSEITAHHGNRRIVLKPRAMGMASHRYLRWLMNRQSAIGGLLEFGYPNTPYWGIQPRDLCSALVLTAFPDPHPEVTTVDGYVLMAAESWINVRSSAIGSSANDSGETIIISAGYESHDFPSYTLCRGFFLFDTSALGDSDTITAATLSLYATGVDAGTGNATLALVTSAPATNTALITADYNDVGSQELGDAIALSVMVEGAYNSITLNGAGRGNVNALGISKFAVRQGLDFDNVAPTNHRENRVVVSSAEVTGTAQDPKLTVTYTAAGAAGAFIPGVIFF